MVRELSRYVGRLLETCSNRGRFASEELWRKRTRACVQTTAFLVCANTNVGWLADIGKLLEDVGSLKTIYLHSMEELDQSFIAPWTCLSIMAIQVALDNEWLRKSSKIAVSALAHLQSQDGTHDNQALKNAQTIDRDLNIAWDCLPPYVGHSALLMECFGSQRSVGRQGRTYSAMNRRSLVSSAPVSKLMILLIVWNMSRRASSMPIVRCIVSLTSYPANYLFSRMIPFENPPLSARW
ncbi:hypothetical protein BJV78DRAFT_954232 [Lactifluus subvellereus]|nr:hypothetical protein BJV78DRAFT_954232 [Lactifluus subvellereus]